MIRGYTHYTIIFQYTPQARIREFYKRGGVDKKKGEGGDKKTFTGKYWFWYTKSKWVHKNSSKYTTLFFHFALFYKLLVLSLKIKGGEVGTIRITHSGSGNAANLFSIWLGLIYEMVFNILRGFIFITRRYFITINYKCSMVSSCLKNYIISIFWSEILEEVIIQWKKISKSILSIQKG